MKQASLNLEKTRKRGFPEQMEQVVPWTTPVTLIAAPTSTKSKERDPEMHSSEKGKQW